MERDLCDYVTKKNITNIQLKGTLPVKKVSKYYEWADLLVMTSKGEGLGVVLLEAMAHGVPVVSTKAGGTTEIIRQGETGILAEEKTPEAMAVAVRRAIRNSAKLAKNAQKQLNEEFDWDVITKHYLNAYKRLTLEKDYHSSEEG